MSQRNSKLSHTKSLGVFKRVQSVASILFVIEACAEFVNTRVNVRVIVHTPKSCRPK